MPWYSIESGPFDPARIGFQGEFGGTGHNVTAKHLWKVERAVKDIGQTYELYKTLDAWNLRGRYLLAQLLSQVELYACAGGVWTQTTDVEGEMNGMMTYDRRILRTDTKKWKAAIQVSDVSNILHDLVCCTLTSIRLSTMLLHAVRRNKPQLHCDDLRSTGAGEKDF